MSPSAPDPIAAFFDTSRWSYWWPAVFWAACIAAFSSNWFSGNHTLGLFIRAASFLLPHLQLEELQNLHAVFRKLAHFSVYFILSVLLFRALRRGRSGWHRRWSLAALLVAIAYAGTDELHQLFTVSRTGSLRDVGIDTLGALAAQLLLWRTKVRRTAQTKS